MRKLQLIVGVAIGVSLGCSLSAQNPVSATVHFPVNSSELDQAAEIVLDQTLEKLDLPFRCYQIEIEGHTDGDGDLAFNDALSRRRTSAVQHRLADRGVPAEAMLPDSRGELAPRFSNESTTGKARNRRVELRFVPRPEGCQKPFEFDVSFEEKKFDARKETHFTYGPSGTRIHVPAYALIDAAGNPVTGEVTYQYREWRDPIGFLASDITMDYPRAHSGQHFHSGGMFEIRAFSEGEEVFLAPGRNVELDFVLTDTSQQYDLYAYDTENKGWHAPGEEPNAGPARADLPSDFCLENVYWGVVEDTVAMFVSMLDSGLFYLNAPRTDGAINFSLMPRFDECWRNKGYLGVDQVADLPEYQWDDYLGISISLTPIGKNAKSYRLKIMDSRGMNSELAAVRHLEMSISALQYKRLPEGFADKKFGDLRLQARAGNTWRLVLKEPGKFHHLVLSARDRRKYRPDRKVSASRDYRIKLGERARAYEELRTNTRLAATFWEYSKPLMPAAERCMRQDQWLYLFGKNRSVMKQRYADALAKYKDNPTLARRDLTTYLDDLAFRWSNGESVAFVPSSINSYASDTVVGSFLADLSISGFGIWNCDQIRRIQQPVTLRPAYVDGSGKRLYIHSISVIDESINGVLSFPGQKFSFSKVSPSVIVAIAHNGERYFMDREAVAAIEADTPDGIFLQLNPIPKEVDTADEMRDLLGLGPAGQLGMR